MQEKFKASLLNGESFISTWRICMYHQPNNEHRWNTDWRFSFSGRMCVVEVILVQCLSLLRSDFTNPCSDNWIVGVFVWDVWQHRFSSLLYPVFWLPLVTLLGESHILRSRGPPPSRVVLFHLSYAIDSFAKHIDDLVLEPEKNLMNFFHAENSKIRQVTHPRFSV